MIGGHVVGERYPPAGIGRKERVQIFSAVYSAVFDGINKEN